MYADLTSTFVEAESLFPKDSAQLQKNGTWRQHPLASSQVHKHQFPSEISYYSGEIQIVLYCIEHVRIKMHCVNRLPFSNYAKSPHRNKDERLTLYKARCEMSKCRKEPYFKEYKINMISLVSQIFVPIKQF